MSQDRQWTDPVSLGSVNRDYDQGFADGCSESKRLNEHLVAASAQGRATGLEEERNGGWIAFSDRVPPEDVALDDKSVSTTRKVLVTNNIKARDRMGRMSHIWLASPIEGNDGWVAFDSRDCKIEFLTHWKDAGVMPANATISPTSSDAGKDDARDAALEEAIRDAIAENMTGLYYCCRTWSAWHVGTMSQNDFWPAGDDDEIIQNITDGVMAAISTKPMAALEDEGNKIQPQNVANDQIARAARKIVEKLSDSPVSALRTLTQAIQDADSTLSSLEVIGKGEKG